LRVVARVRGTFGGGVGCVDEVESGRLVHEV
jgi:hypothetical protein